MSYRQRPPRFYVKDVEKLPFHEKKVDLEEIMAQFIKASRKSMEDTNDLIQKFGETVESTLRIQNSSIAGIETQVGQLTKVLEERLSETIRMEATEEALISGNNFEPFKILNSNVYDFQVQKEEIKLRANDTTPDLPIMKPSRPMMHKWLREKDAEEQVSSQPKPIVEPYCPPIPFPNRLKTRSGNILDSSPFIITNDFFKNVQRIKDDDQELKELERLLENESVELKVCLTKDPTNKFVGDRELLELEYLMEHDGATFLDERVLNQRIDEWKKTRKKTSNETAVPKKEFLIREDIRRMQKYAHTSYSPYSTNTPYVPTLTYGVSRFCFEKSIFAISASRDDIIQPTLPDHLIQVEDKYSKDTWHGNDRKVVYDGYTWFNGNLEDVNTQRSYYMSSSIKVLILRETHKWLDAWIKYLKELEVCMEGLHFDVYARRALE